MHLKLLHFTYFGNRKTWRYSQTRCRSYLYSPMIVMSLWNSSFFLILGIPHLCLSTLTTEGTWPLAIQFFDKHISVGSRRHLAPWGNCMTSPHGATNRRLRTSKAWPKTSRYNHSWPSSICDDTCQFRWEFSRSRVDLVIVRVRWSDLLE